MHAVILALLLYSHRKEQVKPTSIAVPQRRSHLSQASRTPICPRFARVLPESASAASVYGRTFFAPARFRHSVRTKGCSISIPSRLPRRFINSIIAVCLELPVHDLFSEIRLGCLSSCYPGMSDILIQHASMNII